MSNVPQNKSRSRPSSRSRPLIVPTISATVSPIVPPPDDMGVLSRAYFGALEDGLPTSWTPAHVQTRLIEAFKVIHKTTTRGAPKAFGSNWPNMLREFDDLVDAQSREQMEIDGVEEARRRGLRPTADMIERADEAMGWCARYLAHDQAHADAIQLWAFCKARGFDMRKMLRRRRVAVDIKVQRRQADKDAHRLARRSEIAKEATEWANRRLASATSPEQVERIRANAFVRASRAIEASPDCTARKVLRQDVMPGRAFTRTWLDAMRKEAANTLASLLNRDGVRVR